MREGNYRTLTAGGATEMFGVRRDCENRAQRLANRTGKWVGIEHREDGEWGLIDVKHPFGVQRDPANAEAGLIDPLDRPEPTDFVERTYNALREEPTPFGELRLGPDDKRVYDTLVLLKRQGRADIDYGFGWYRTAQVSGE